MWSFVCWCRSTICVGRSVLLVCVHDLGVLACVSVLAAVGDEKDPQHFKIGCCPCAVLLTI